MYNQNHLKRRIDSKHIQERTSNLLNILETLIHQWYEENKDKIYQEYMKQENIHRKLFDSKQIQEFGYPCGIRKRIIRHKEID
jgi:hypothetical protein